MALEFPIKLEFRNGTVVLTKGVKLRLIQAPMRLNFSFCVVCWNSACRIRNLGRLFSETLLQRWCSSKVDQSCKQQLLTSVATPDWIQWLSPKLWFLSQPVPPCHSYTRSCARGKGKKPVPEWKPKAKTNWDSLFLHFVWLCLGLWWLHWFVSHECPEWLFVMTFNWVQLCTAVL